jgi:formylglycine-generating enzyme required for sulfatase activity
LSAHHGSNLTLADISLDSYTNDGGTPGTFSWTTPDNSVGDHGTQSHNITFTPADTAKYNTVTGDVDVLVSIVEMVLVKAGTYTMGSPASEPYREADEFQFKVTVSDDFYLGKYEVTQAQWYKVMEKTMEEQQALQTTVQTNFGRGDDYPIYHVNWYEILVFCNTLSEMEGLTPAYAIDGDTDVFWWGALPTSNNGALQALWNTVEIVAGSNGYRLPTEFQWEYACRAGTTTPWHSAATEDDETNPVTDYAWIQQNTGKSGEPNYATQPVGTRKPNAWGLYDMHGNVKEWCWDRYGTYPTALTDPFGVWSTGYNRVIRGGTWNASARYTRSAYRGDGKTTTAYGYSRSQTVGFRLARPVQ